MTNKALIKLLIVEDDEDDYFLTRELLERSRLLTFDIEWVANAGQARQVLREDRHDICLMDYQLGPEVGVNLVREAVENGFSAPIIMLTAQENIGVELEAANAGASDYLLKDNLTFEQLFRSIKYALSRREIEAERLERQRAEAANRSKTEFLANLSHEIRTPLTAIIGYTELLVKQNSDFTAAVKSKLEIINRNSKHLLSLLNDTLDLSKIEAGKLEVDISDVDTEAFLTDIFSLAQALAQEKGLSFRTEIKTELPAVLRTDAIRLRQILLNLLGNAFKFTNNGGVILSVSLHSEGAQNTLVFEVTDTGRGIPNHELRNIFNPFVQNNYNLDAPGTGLGLTISQKLAENLGGAISVTSEFGRGSSFLLSIDPGPVTGRRIREVNLRQTASSFPKSVFANVRGKILIVDDIADIRSLLANILDEVGLEHDSCNDGQAALDKIMGTEPGTFALILMDLGMPGMDGYEAIRKLREKRLDIPAIALTATNLQGEREKCLATGFNAYVPKPVSAAMLLAAISAVLKAHGEDISPREDSRGDMPVQSAASEDRPSILVLEDNLDANRTICELLEIMGYESAGVLNCDEARASVQRERPDLILSDINLDGGTSLDFLREVHEEYPDVRICLISGQDENPENLPGYVDGYLKKPVMMDHMRRMVADIFSGRRSVS